VADETVAFQGWNASGVGWGEDPWGESLADLPTGTGQVGSVIVTADAPVPVTGVSASAFVGTVTTTAGADIPVTGVEATGALGTVVVSGAATVALAGVFASGEVGSVATTAGANVLVLGVSAAAVLTPVLVWAVVDDSQIPNWQNVDDGNTVVWTQVIT
jgi:hypothetical protein